jgi:flagellar basal-body rod protein FlgG
MANIALQSAATGLSALNTKLDVIANNLANVNTTGFKGSRANFEDLLYIERAQPGVENASGEKRPIGLSVGLGVKVSGTELDFTQGALINTGRDLDMAIDGLGFFKVQVEDGVGGGVAYTRAGQFAVNADGEIVMASDQGRRLIPNIKLPSNYIPPVTVTADGHVQVLEPGNTQPTDLDQIKLVAFVNPAGLRQIGNNLYIESAASGSPIEGNPNSDNFGAIRQNVVEASNVDPTFELIEMIRTQRAFEMNSNSIRAADQTLQSIAQLRR